MRSILTERRAADRKAMAKALTELGATLGATVTIEPIGSYEISLKIEHPSGLCVYISLDGKTPHARPNTFVLPWHMRGHPETRLARSFGTVNPHHQRKATHVVDGWSALHAEIKRGLTAANDGSAFE